MSQTEPRAWEVNVGKWMIQYQVLGEEKPRVQLLEEESRTAAVKLCFDDFFADNPGGKVKLLAALETIDGRDTQPPVGGERE